MYNKKEWVSDEIITKEALNNIEEGIFNKPEFSQYQDYKIINVKEHGVVGDGVANDGPMLKEIFANVEDYSVIYFPAGIYLLGNGDESETSLELDSKKCVKIIGHSMSDTKILIHPQTPALKKTGIIHLFKTEYCSIENIELDGNSQARHVANGGVNWGDNGVTTDACDNISVDGANYTIIRNVYSHHPMKDCIETSRYAGGDTPNNHHLLIEDCILDYGYRQGLSIVGTDHGIIRNCRITNTAKAPNLYLNDGTSTIGTSPKAGIDSETWTWNHDWIIENCYFENNAGGHINMNDGASEHVIRDNYFVGGNGIGCETPSTGTRTLNNIITNNRFINANLSSLHGSFMITNNSFYYDDPTKTNAGVSLVLHEKPFGRNGKILFDGNRIVARLDLYESAGVDLSTLNISCSFGANTIITNNVFHNLIAPTTPIHIANSVDLVFSGNIMTTSHDLKNILDPANIKIVKPNGAKIENNFIDTKYPIEIRTAFNDISHSTKFTKIGEVYSSKLVFTMYNKRKYLLPIINFSEMTTLHCKVKLSTATSAASSFTIPDPINTEYNILVHKNGEELTQKVIFNNPFNCQSHLISCTGFEVIDGIVYLGIANEYISSSFPAIFEFEIIDNSGKIENVLNLGDMSKYESVVQEIPSALEAREYVVGEQVRSYASTGGVYLYEVTTGGTVVTTQKFMYPRGYNVDGVAFAYKGCYEGQYRYGMDNE